MTEEFVGHTGKLEADSPALWSHFRREFTPEECEKLSEAYENSAALGGLCEGRVKRAEGVRFNPRPARIARILITEAKEKSFEVFIDALSATAPEVNTEKLPIQIRLALALDTLRHLHMTDLDDTEITEARIEESKIVESSATEHQFPRLVTLITSATRLDSRHQENDSLSA